MSSISVDNNGEKRKDGKPFVKSSSDKLEYKYLVLNNGLKALLISDPNVVPVKSDDNKCELESEDSGEDDLTDVSSCEEHDAEVDNNNSDVNDMESDSDIKSGKKSEKSDKLAAVAVCVKAGSFRDPKQVPGLAHLVEHVLTMGSEQYPEENSLDDFLNSRGGYQNAHTEYEYTMYEIEVHKNHLYEALKRLAHCFICPLLRADSIKREIKPIDTEFNEALPDDEVRIEQLICDMANDDHPLRIFSWGNALTLQTHPANQGINVHNYVKDFVKKYYVSDNMYVVVQSQESLETLEKWITELFSLVKHSDSKEKLINTEIGFPFENNPNFNRLFLVEPINETDQLNIMWCLPPVLSLYKTSPLDYLGTIVGHEGKGSLISLLRKENLALECCAGNDDSGFHSNSYSSMFVISIKLTQLGHKNIDKVVNYVSEYLNVLRSVGPQEWYFKELQTIELNKFNFQEEKSAITYVKKLIIHLMHYPVEHVLCGNKLYFQYDKELIDSFLNRLTTDTANFVHLCSSILDQKDSDVRTEEWMATKYKMVEVPDSWLKNIKSNTEQSNYFSFPISNQYIATDFTIKECPDCEWNVPKKILEKKNLKVWYKPDDQFNQPKAIIKMHLVSPYFRESVDSSVMTDLFLEILAQNLIRDVYDATLAGLNYNITQTAAGLVISVNGFNHKLNILLKTILYKMVNFDVEDKAFNDIKYNLSKSYHNLFIDPNNLNNSLRVQILTEIFYSAIQKREILYKFDKNMVNSFVKNLFKNYYLETLIQGNYTSEQSIELISELETLLKVDSLKETLREPRICSIEIPMGNSCCRVISLCETNKNSSITNYYQISPANIKLQCMLALLSSIMEEPCFNTLRTQEGLGYYVGATDYDNFGVSGFGITVSSSGDDFHCTFIDERIEEFLLKMNELLNNMAIETFKEHVNSIVKSKKAPDLHLMEEFTRNWTEIASFNFCFDRLTKEIDCLEKLTFDEFKRWTFSQALGMNGKKRKLSIQIVGHGKRSLEECITFDDKPLSSDVINKIETDSAVNKDNNYKKFKLIHLKPKQSSKYKYCYISDINQYKKRLNIYPNHKVIE